MITFSKKVLPNKTQHLFKFVKHKNLVKLNIQTLQNLTLVVSKS